MNRASRTGRFCSTISTAASIVLLSACGALPANSALRIELQQDPVALYDAGSQKTTVVLQFLVRDGSGNPVDPATTTLRRYVNGQLADVESIANLQDTKLPSSLRLGMVLDASYSMVAPAVGPPAFQPMKQAAHDALQSIADQFASWNSGMFVPFASWFQDQYVCSESGPAAPNDVLAIPTPSAGDSTKLFAATAQMIDRLKQIYDAGTGWTAADHFALVVFTDGYDNYSWADTSGAASVTIAPFTCAGIGPMTLDGVTAKLHAFSQLKVYVIGLGTDFKTSELTAIADAGNGRFVSNPDTGQVPSLFAEITREFTTVRRDGITMPLPPGDYDYVEEVAVGGSVARVHFKFHAGDANAAVTGSISSS